MTDSKQDEALEQYSDLFRMLAINPAREITFGRVEGEEEKYTVNRNGELLGTLNEYWATKLQEALKMDEFGKLLSGAEREKQTKKSKPLDIVDIMKITEGFFESMERK